MDYDKEEIWKFVRRGNRCNNQTGKPEEIRAETSYGTAFDAIESPEAYV